MNRNGRGIGLEFVKQLLNRPSTHVLAAVRNITTATELHALEKQFPGRLNIISIDVSSAASIEGGVKEVEKLVGVIDVLINNAGVLVGGWTNAIEGLVELLSSCTSSRFFSRVSPQPPTTQLTTLKALHGTQD